MSDEQNMQSESANPSLDSEKALLQLAESFDPGAASRSVLHPYKRSILLLRAKHATYDKIVAMLKEVGVKTSIFSVSRFCRQYRAEIKKLRVQLESRKPPAELSEHLLQAGTSDGQLPTTRKKRF